MNDSQGSRGAFGGEMRRGVLQDFDSMTYRVVVQLDGSVASYLSDVPVNMGLDSAALTAGRAVAVWFFNAGDPQSAVVLGVWE